MTVSTWTHQQCIHKYYNFHYWWTAVAWYLTDQVKSEWILKKLASHALCYVKIYRLLTNWWQLMWINDWIIQWRRHRYHRWWKIIPLWVTVLDIKAPFITRSVQWRSGWLLTNRGQLSRIYDWIIQWRRNINHRLRQPVPIWVTVLVIKSPVITMSR